MFTHCKPLKINMSKIVVVVAVVVAVVVVAVVVVVADLSYFRPVVTSYDIQDVRIEDISSLVYFHNGSFFCLKLQCLHGYQ